MTGRRLAVLVLGVRPRAGGGFGTERVSRDLAAHWAAAGHAVTLAAHAEADGASAFAPEGVTDAVLPPLPAPTRREQFSRRTAAPGLAALLGATRPDVAVVVGFGPHAANLTHLDALAAAGVPAALWHHVPGVTCQQHGLKRMGRTPCDGRVAVGRCAACRLAAAGLPAPLAQVAALSPLGAGAAAVPGPLGHVLGGRALSALFAGSVAALRARVAHVFVGARWVADVMTANGFDPARLSLVRPGVPADLAARLAARRRVPGDGTLRLALWGRIDDTKGIDTAIRAVRRVPGVALAIAGPFDPARPYDARLQMLAEGDGRIRFVGRLEADGLAALLAASEAALVPSPWPETGPLTVFEARAAGLPILGARTGGIAEMCSGDPSARLFAAGDDGALAAEIAALAAPGIATARAASVPPARTMADAAAEMLPTLACLACGGRG